TPLLHRCSDASADGDVARVVDQDVDAAEGVYGRVDNTHYIVGARDVGDSSDRVEALPLKFLQRSSEVFPISSTDRDSRAFRSELLGDSPTDAFARPSDDRHFSLKVQIHETMVADPQPHINYVRGNESASREKTKADCEILTSIACQQNYFVLPVRKIVPKSENLPETLDGSGFCLGRFLFTVPRRGDRLQCIQQSIRDGCYLIDCGEEHGLVCLRGFVEAADLAYKLERRCSNLLRGYRGFKVKEGLNIPAHLHYLLCGVVPAVGVEGLEAIASAA